MLRLLKVFLIVVPVLFPAPSFPQPRLPDAHLNLSGVTPSAECGKCHKDIFSAWENSLHAQATVNPVFWAAYLKTYYRAGDEARLLCLSCHAPLAPFNGDYQLKEPLTRESVNCDFCHSVSSVDLKNDKRRYFHEFGAVKQGSLENAKSPVHATRFNPLFRQSLFCAGCHEYAAPGGVKLIETFTEWERGPYPQKGVHCQDCHMKKIPGEVVVPEVKESPSGSISTHDIAGGHSLSMREKSLKLEITAVKTHRQKVAVSVAVTNQGAGHKIPTGLPSKKLILKVTLASEKEGYRQTQERIYQKVLVDLRGTPVTDDSEIMLGREVKVKSDNRIRPEETRIEEFVFFVPEAPDRKVTAAVIYGHTPTLIQEAPIYIQLQETTRQIEP